MHHQSYDRVSIWLHWLVAIAVKSGGAFFTESVGKDMLGKVGGVAEKHWGPPGAYFISVWGTFWPAAPLTALAGLFAWRERKEDAVLFLLAWLLPMWVVLEAMPTKLPHYILPLLPAVSILILLAMERRSIPQSGWRPPVGAALMLLIPLGMMIGAPLAFWRMDGSVPLVILPLLGLATVIAALAARALWESRMGAALVLGLVAAVPLSIAGFKFGMPQFETINLSRRLADIAKAQGCTNPRYATVSYREPSLVFLTATHLNMLRAEEVPQFFAGNEGDCRIAFLDGKDEGPFRASLPQQGATSRIAGTVKGTNINGGRKLELNVWIKR